MLGSFFVARPAVRRLHAKCVCLVYACAIFSLVSPFAIGTDSNSGF